MPTRSTLALLFVFLVAVPVGTAIWLGTAGLSRERAMLVERERQRMEQRADEVRDALVRALQALYVEEAGRGAADYGQQKEDARAPVQGRFEQEAAGFPQNAEMEEQTLYLEDDVAYRKVNVGGRALIQGFRVDVALAERRFLDPASPHSVLPRLDERIERASLVPEDGRLRSQGRDAWGLPLAVYRHVIPTGANRTPVLLPAGHQLALSVRPAAALARDVADAERQLLWTLGVLGAVVVLGLLFAWRAVSAEARLAARKTEFVSAVSHELRTPLTSIRMYADMLKEGWVKDERTAKEYFALLSAESERLARLVNNVLDFSRIGKGGRALDLRVGDPAPVVREAAEVLRPYLKEKGRELHLEVPESLPACAFDKDALMQILVNLIDNAVKYGEKEVRLAAEARDGQVVVSVLDRGPGVPPGDRARIFEPFERGRNETRSGGSGLGLALVKHYAEAHRGRIEVSDRDGGGAAFTLRLPAAG